MKCFCCEVLVLDKLFVFTLLGWIKFGFLIERTRLYDSFFGDCWDSLFVSEYSSHLIFINSRSYLTTSVVHIPTCPTY